jgi:hypothetical protein
MSMTTIMLFLTFWTSVGVQQLVYFGLASIADFKAASIDNNDHVTVNAAVFAGRDSCFSETLID